ncbi:MAG: hypothetical protein GY869_06325 [Planctomycetes bacterium]|nr:hypothetical protein [Planctomycetota bacterium]
MTKKDYAEYRGVSPGYISKLIKKGDWRLVLKGNMVDADATDRNLVVRHNPGGRNLKRSVDKDRLGELESRVEGLELIFDMLRDSITELRGA